LKIAMIEKQVNERLMELARKAYQKIKDGRSVSTRIEGSEIVIHKPEDFGWQCLVIDRSIDKAKAGNLLRDLAALRIAKTGRFPVVALFFEPGAELSLQARKLLEAEGLRLYWVSSWHQ